MTREQKETTYLLFIEAVSQLLKEETREPSSILFSTAYALYAELAAAEALPRADFARALEEQGDGAADVIRFCSERFRISRPATG